MNKFLQNSFVYDQKISWGDMDAFGHVNNVMYYRYVENARISYFDELDIFNYPMNIVVASNKCQYFSPVVYPDSLKIEVKILEVRNSAFCMHYILWSESQQKIVAESEAVIVCVNKGDGQKILIPPKLKHKILMLKDEYNKDV